VNLWRNASWKRRLAVVAGGTGLVLLAGAGLGYAVTDVPEPNSFAQKQALRLLYANGQEMARFGTNRVMVQLDQVSPAAQHAVLAAEDRDFYSEPGISIKGIARALFTNVRGGGVSQGGSTITQQYAKNAFLSQERTFTRKIKEVFIALKMSRTVSKDQILEDYLNTIYFGRGAFGIESAAETYFGVHAKDLTVAQAAVLASSIRSPAGYDPARHPDRAKARWEYVLDGMVKKRWLSASDRAGQQYPKVLPRGASGSLPGDLDHVRDQVVAELEKHGFTEERIAAGGLTVTTTIVKKAQDAARAAIADQLPQKKKDDPVGALVAVEPRTGKVIAYYGGSKAGDFDYASDGKGVQPGSSMKPYVLATALENGKSLATKYDGHSPQDVCGQQVHNDSGDPPNLGQVDLSTALALSVNVVYMRLACDVGPKKVADLAHAAGIDEHHDLGGKHPAAGIALGIYEVHPIDQAVGYATFAAQGERATPYFVLRVADSDGNVVYRARTDRKRVFSADVAADATYAMQQVVKDGTGKNARIPGRPTAGKTGTTQSNKNAWFCGFTPQLAAAVWVGRPSGDPLKGAGLGGGVYGGTIPAKIFRAFMKDALDGQPVKQFPPRANVGPTPSATPAPTVTATATAAPSSTPLPTSVPTVSPTLPAILPTQTQNPNPKPTATSSPTPAPTASP
jgi:membrane peptidoglycan carboxypeptidase